MKQDVRSLFESNPINICVTGGAGFIGSHMVRRLFEAKKCGAPIGHIVVYDKLTYAADLNRLKEVDYHLVEGDILDEVLLLSTFEKFNISHIVHFAAESHVDRSLLDPTTFLTTNVLGTAKLLEASTQFWNHPNSKVENPLFIHISTDEVYGYTLKPAHEESKLNPGNPYAASKAAADQLVIAQINAHRFPAIILRSSNNYGSNQNPEKFIPKMMEQVKRGEPLTVYGKGEQKRCWLHVQDYVEVIWQLILNPKKGQVFNITGTEVYSNLALAQMIKTIFADIRGISIHNTSEIAFVEDRKAHDFYYNVSDEKIRSLYPVKKHTGTLIDFIKSSFEENNDKCFF